MLVFVYALGIALALVVLVLCNTLVSLITPLLVSKTSGPDEILLRVQEALVRNVFACVLTGLSIGSVSLAVFDASSWASEIPVVFVFFVIPTIAFVSVVGILAWIRISVDSKNRPGVFCLWFLFLFFAFLPFLYQKYLPSYEGDIFELFY